MATRIMVASIPAPAESSAAGANCCSAEDTAAEIAAASPAGAARRTKPVGAAVPAARVAERSLGAGGQCAERGIPAKGWADAARAMTPRVEAAADGRRWVRAGDLPSGACVGPATGAEAGAAARAGDVGAGEAAGGAGAGAAAAGPGEAGAGGDGSSLGAPAPGPGEPAPGPIAGGAGTPLLPPAGTFTCTGGSGKAIA